MSFDFSQLGRKKVNLDSSESKRFEEKFDESNRSSSLPIPSGAESYVIDDNSGSSSSSSSSSSFFDTINIPKKTSTLYENISKKSPSETRASLSSIIDSDLNDFQNVMSSNKMVDVQDMIHEKRMDTNLEQSSNLSDIIGKKNISVQSSKDSSDFFGVNSNTPPSSSSSSSSTDSRPLDHYSQTNNSTTNTTTTSNNNNTTSNNNNINNNNNNNNNSSSTFWGGLFGETNTNSNEKKNVSISLSNDESTKSNPTSSTTTNNYKTMKDYYSNVVNDATHPDYDESKEKQDLIFKLQRMKRRGVPISKHFTTDDSLRDIKEEFLLLKREKDLQGSIKFQSDMTVYLVRAVEYINEEFLSSFDVDLEGWGDSFEDNIGEYEDIFEELHEQHGHLFRTNPVFRLVGGIVLSGIVYHKLKQRLNGGSRRRNNGSNDNKSNNDYDDVASNIQNTDPTVFNLLGSFANGFRNDGGNVNKSSNNTNTHTNNNNNNNNNNNHNNNNNSNNSSSNNSSVPMSNDILKEMANIRRKYNQQQQQKVPQQTHQYQQPKVPQQQQHYIPSTRPRPSRTKTKTTSDGIQLGL